MNHVSLPRHIYKNASIKTNYGNNKQSLKPQVLQKKSQVLHLGRNNHANQYRLGSNNPH